MAKKIRIAFIGGHTYPIPAIKGGAIQTLTTALLDQNETQQAFDITVITGYHPELKNASEKYRHTKVIGVNPNKLLCCAVFGYRVIRKLLRNKIPLKTAFMVTANRILKKQQFDAVILETDVRNAVQIKARGKAKVFFHVHADYFNESLPEINIFAKKCDYIVGVSDFIRDRIAAVPGFNDKAVALANAIDINSTDEKQAIAYRTEIRAKYGYKQEDTVILYCSRLSPEKGCLELIKAVKQTDNCKLLVVGGENFYSDKITDYVKELKAEAEKTDGRVCFTGSVPHNEVFKYMSAADIGVVPSVCNEAASLTILELRNAGLPTVASRRGGVPEYCNSNTTLLVDTHGDFVKNLSVALQTLVNTPSLRAEMATAAKTGLEQFGYSAYYKRFLDLINSKLEN